WQICRCKVLSPPWTSTRPARSPVATPGLHASQRASRHRSGRDSARDETPSVTRAQRMEFIVPSGEPASCGIAWWSCQQRGADGTGREGGYLMSNHSRIEAQLVNLPTRKLRLADLQVQSFVTALDEHEASQIAGGYPWPTRVTGCIAESI